MGIVVYRSTDRVTLKILDVTFKIKPLSYQEKMDISSEIWNHDGAKKENSITSARKIMKYAIKEVDGVSYPDGTTFELRFDENNHLTDECTEELSNMEISSELIVSLYSFVKGVPKEILNPVDGKKMENVMIVPLEKPLSKKK